MLLYKEFNNFKLLNEKKTRRGRLNSALYKKYSKNSHKPIYNNSYIIPQPLNDITNSSYEESKRIHNSNYSNSMLVSEKEKNFLTKNLKRQININKLRENKTQKNIIPHIFETKNIYNTLTKRENNNNYFKNKPRNINTFITEINSFLLPNNKTFKTLKNLINYKLINNDYLKNPVLLQLFERHNFPMNKLTYESFHKYIITKTFKEVSKKGLLNDSIIDQKEIIKEYHKQLNKLKLNLILFNEKNKDENEKEDLQSLVINNNSSFIKNFNINKTTLNENSEIMNIIKQKRNKSITQNNSLHNIYSRYDINSNESCFDLNNQNIKNKNQTKNKLISLPNKIIKNNGNSQNKIFNNSNEKKMNKIIQKAIIPNIKNQSKENHKLRMEFTCREIIKKSNFLLDKVKHNEYNNKNGDIINCINNERKIQFSNELINNKLKQNLFNLNNFKLKVFKLNDNKNIKKENYDNKDFINNSLNLEKKYKNNDLSFQSRDNHNSSFCKNVSSKKVLFEQKSNFVKDYLDEESENIIKKKNNSIETNHEGVFHKDNEEKIKGEESRKIVKIFIKKKKKEKEKTFKDFIKEENYEDNLKAINNKFSENNLIKINKIKIEENEDLKEEEWQNKINNFKNYIQRLKNLSKEEFIKDTFKYIKY